MPALTVDLDADVAVSTRLMVPQGEDWSMTVACVDSVGAAVAVALPQMQIRQGPYVSSKLILGPPNVGLTVAGNVITVSIPAEASATVTDGIGSFDLYAVRSSSGLLVRVLEGRVTFDAPVTDVTLLDFVDLGNGLVRVAVEDYSAEPDGTAMDFFPLSGSSGVDNGDGTLTITYV